MNEHLKNINKLVANNKTDAAIKILVEETKNNPELQNQIFTLSAKFKDLRTREIMGLIGFNEASILFSQINYAILNIAKEHENTPLSEPAPFNPKKVFISYNHNDTVIANQLKDKLKANNIDVTIDSEKMQAGDDIKTFIENCISNTETTISIISKKSLLSAWVAMESINTFYHEKTNSHKKFIACYIEDDFFKRNFTDEALDYIDGELSAIQKLINDRMLKGRNTRDLNNEYTRLKELSNGMDEIVRRLRESLCIDISNENLEMNFTKILEKIKM